MIMFIFIAHTCIYFAFCHFTWILELCSSCLFFVKQSAWSERKKLARHSQFGCMHYCGISTGFSNHMQHIFRWSLNSLLGRRKIFGAVATLAFYDGHLGARGHKRSQEVTRGHKTRYNTKQHQQIGELYV